MFSKLSSGVKNATYFNQAARNVACMAETMKRAARPSQAFRALGFYVLSPASQIAQGLFNRYLTRLSIQTIVERRVKEYEGQRDKWFSDWFMPVIERLEIQAISWEDIIDFLSKQDPDVDTLKEFYRRCLEFNKVSQKLPA